MRAFDGEVYAAFLAKQFENKIKVTNLAGWWVAGLVSPDCAFGAFGVRDCAFVIARSARARDCSLLNLSSGNQLIAIFNN